MSGPAYSVHALTVSGLALAALAFLAWTLGASGTDDPAAGMLRSAADDAPDGLLIAGSDGSFVYTNPAFHRLFHMAAAAGSGGQVESLDAIGRALEGDEAVTAFQRLKSNAETGVGGRAEFPISSGAPGTVEWRRLTVSPVAGGGALWWAEDITASREVDSVRRELEQAMSLPQTRRTVREDFSSQLGIDAQFMPELQEMVGAGQAVMDFDGGLDLFGRPQQTVEITLERVVKTTVAQNLELEFARFAPAVAAAQIVQAEAAFDWTLFSTLDLRKGDRPATSPTIGNRAVGLGTDVRDSVNWTTGIRRQFVSGGQLSIQHELIFTDTKTPGLATTPDPAKEIGVVLQYDQPLLRGFGSDVMLSQVRLQRNAERDEIAALEFRRVMVSGVFLHDREMFFFATRQGSAGFHVITPLRRTGGGGVLIDRGWVPVEARDPAHRAAGQIGGAVTIEGLVRAPQEPGWFTPDNDPTKNYWFWRDVPAMAAFAGFDAPPLIVEAGPAANPGGLPIGRAFRFDIANDHLQYAILWYLLAAALAVIYVLSQRSPVSENG